MLGLFGVLIVLLKFFPKLGHWSVILSGVGSSVRVTSAILGFGLLKVATVDSLGIWTSTLENTRVVCL